MKSNKSKTLKGDPESVIRSIRQLAVTAMFADDILLDRLVLKGGNALNLIYKIGGRASIDVDFSMSGEFENIDEIEYRIGQALERRFTTKGFTVFDYTFEVKPSANRPGQDPAWGGYQVKFKVAKSASLSGKETIEDLRKIHSLPVGGQGGRTFTIDISKNEFCEGKQSETIDSFVVYVYTLEMLAIEKLRAICQQMPDYKLRAYRTPRARDFYDIHTLVSTAGVRFCTRENVRLLRSIFAAKKVDVSLLFKLESERDFHQPDWVSVVNSTSESLQSFDFYFDFVKDLVLELEAFGVE